MEIEKASSLVIKTIGELTVYSAGAFKQYLIREGSKYAEIGIDLSHITWLDTTGFQLLLATRCWADCSTKSIRFVNPSPDVLRLCTIY